MREAAARVGVEGALRGPGLLSGPATEDSLFAPPAPATGGAGHVAFLPPSPSELPPCLVPWECSPLEDTEKLHEVAAA